MTTIDDIKRELERVITETEERLANGEALNPDEWNLLRTYRALLTAIKGLKKIRENGECEHSHDHFADDILQTICENWNL